MKKILTKSPQKKFHVRSGDLVEVISGNHKTTKDRKVTGRVLAVNRKTNRAKIEGVAMITKHTRKNPQNNQGGLVQTEGTIHISNLRVLEKYVHDKEGKAARAAAAK